MARQAANAAHKLRMAQDALSLAQDEVTSCIGERNDAFKKSIQASNSVGLLRSFVIQAAKNINNCRDGLAKAQKQDNDYPAPVPEAAPLQGPSEASATAASSRGTGSGSTRPERAPQTPHEALMQLLRETHVSRRAHGLLG